MGCRLSTVRVFYVRPGLPGYRLDVPGLLLVLVGLGLPTLPPVCGVPAEDVVHAELLLLPEVL